jgi:hypothetical protein
MLHNDCFFSQTGLAPIGEVDIPVFFGLKYTLFCLGDSRFWNTPIHVLLRRLRNKYNRLWLRFTMSYHRFNNLCEMFQGYLNRVLMKNVESEDYRDRPCNCPGRGCRFVCRKALIVNKVTIPRTGKYYIGATLQTLKQQVAGHLQSACQFLRNGTRSSTLAIHLALMWK